jgi:hypothetical protein
VTTLVHRAGDFRAPHSGTTSTRAPSARKVATNLG